MFGVENRIFKLWFELAWNSTLCRFQPIACKVGFEAQFADYVSTPSTEYWPLDLDLVVDGDDTTQLASKSACAMVMGRAFFS